MTIQRQDIMLIVLGVLFGVVFMWFVAQSWWVAVLVGVVCGAGGGTLAAIWMRVLRPRKAPRLNAAGNGAQR
jgi:hypothetical protein